MGKKAKERQKGSMDMERKGKERKEKEREKMGKDECQIGAKLRDDNTLYYNTCHIGCGYIL